MASGLPRGGGGEGDSRDTPPPQGGTLVWVPLKAGFFCRLEAGVGGGAAAGQAGSGWQKVTQWCERWGGVLEDSTSRQQGPSRLLRASQIPAYLSELLLNSKYRPLQLFQAAAFWTTGSWPHSPAVAQSVAGWENHPH